MDTLIIARDVPTSKYLLKSLNIIYRTIYESRESNSMIIFMLICANILVCLFIYFDSGSLVVSQLSVATIWTKRNQSRLTHTKYMVEKIRKFNDRIQFCFLWSNFRPLYSSYIVLMPYLFWNSWFLFTTYFAAFQVFKKMNAVFLAIIHAVEIVSILSWVNFFQCFSFSSFSFSHRC